MKWINDVGFFAKHLWSVRFAIIGVVWASAGSTWMLLPPEWKPALSEPIRWGLGIVGVLLASAPGFAVLMHQPKLAAEVEKHTGAPAGNLPPAVKAMRER